MPGSTTRTSPAGPEPAPRRSPGSPRGSTTARVATGPTLDRRSARPSRARPIPYPAGARAVSAQEGRERLRLAIPNKGRLVEPTLALLHDAGLDLRGARPEPRRARPELRPRHPVRPHERRHRVRRRRRRRPRDHRRGPARRDRRRAAACSATLGYGHCRLAAAVPADSAVRSSPTWPACGSPPPTRTPPAASSPSGGSTSTSSRSRAPSRSRRGSAWPRRSSISSRPARRWSMNGLRPIGDVLAVGGDPRRATRRRSATRPDEIAAIDTMLSAGHRRARSQVPDDERAGRRLAELEALLPGLESPSVIPLAHDGHDRDPRGGRRRRRSGACCPGSRPPARRGSSSSRSRRSSRDAPLPAAVRPRSGLAPARPRLVARDRPSPQRERSVRRGAVPDQAVRERRPRDPRRGPDRRRRRRPRRQRARSAAAWPTGASSSTRPSSRRPRPPAAGRSARALDQAIEHVTPLRGDPAAGDDPDDDRPGHRDRAPLDPARPGRLLRARRLGAVPVVAGHDRRPGPRRRRRRVRRRVARRPRRAVDPVLARRGRPPRRRRSSSSPAAPRRSARWRSGCRASRRRARSIGSSARATRGSRRPSSRSAGDVGIDLPAGPSEGMVLADADRRPRARRRRPGHPGRARPRLAGHPRHDGRRRLPTPSSARSPPLASAARRDDPRPRASRPRPDRRSRPTSTRPSPSSTPTRPSTSRSTSTTLERGRRPAPPRGLALRRAVGARDRPATTRRAPTTSCRRAASPAAPARSRSRRSASSCRSSASTRDGPGGHPRRRSAPLAEAEGLTAHRDAVEVRFREPTGARRR